MARIGVIDALRNIAALLQREDARADVEGVDDPILALRGVGKEIWANEEADAYVERLRQDWQ